ncbi:MAG: bifunctional 3,4-dihydroxy-2-butanone-4-phosphate synthase/GTP cyclohydrolase II, partial [Bacteroidetes bacterium]|nr:bifunctional 3,4-dihydroxy-2-butanone-4-phosphate synthase/GTP cyclohydrolase II [Bacteroidota bacterium]
DYGVGAQMLRDLGVRKMRLMSNNPKKRTGLIGYGLEIVENVPLEIESNEYNENYLKVKKDKFGHNLKLNP